MSEPDFVVYHNPRCSKSRAVLALLHEHGIEPRIVEYLKNPPNAGELRALLNMLGIAARELVRSGEQAFKDNYAGRSLSDAEWIEAMVANPLLIERPIVVRGEQAVLARPPDKVRELL